MACSGGWTLRMARWTIAGVCSSAIALPNAALAKPAAKHGPDLKAVEVGFGNGMDLFDKGDFNAAIKTWAAAAALLPETPEHRPNRTALYEKIAEAYENEFDRIAAVPDAQERAARKALAMLDAYADSHTKAYPGEPLPGAVEKTRADASGIVAAADARSEAAKPVEAAPEPEPTGPPPKPWKPLAIGGGIALAGGVSMLAMFAVGVARARRAEASFDDPANNCVLGQATGACADFDKQGKSGNALATAGLVIAPLLVGAGVALLVIAARRKKATTRSISPLWRPRMAGLVFEQRF